MISSDTIRELREKTGISVMECKNALEETNGDIKEAVRVLDKKFGGMASEKASRAANDGIVEAYVHTNGKIGVLLQLHSETDFVARNPAFRELAHDIAMQIAAMSPENPDDLFSQPFIKDPNRTIRDIIEEAVGKF